MSGDGDDADDVNDNVSSDEDWCVTETKKSQSSKTRVFHHKMMSDEDDTSTDGDSDVENDLNGDKEIQRTKSSGKFDKYTYEKMGGIYECRHCGIKDPSYRQNLSLLFEHESVCPRRQTEVGSSIASSTQMICPKAAANPIDQEHVADNPKAVTESDAPKHPANKGMKDKKKSLKKPSDMIRLKYSVNGGKNFCRHCGYGGTRFKQHPYELVRHEKVCAAAKTENSEKQQSDSVMDADEMSNLQKRECKNKENTAKAAGSGSVWDGVIVERTFKQRKSRNKTHTLSKAEYEKNGFKCRYCSKYTPWFKRSTFNLARHERICSKNPNRPSCKQSDISKLKLEKEISDSGAAASVDQEAVAEGAKSEKCDDVLTAPGMAEIVEKAALLLKAATVTDHSEKKRMDWSEVRKKHGLGTIYDKSVYVAKGGNYRCYFCDKGYADTQKLDKLYHHEKKCAKTRKESETTYNRVAYEKAGGDYSCLFCKSTWNNFTHLPTLFNHQNACQRKAMEKFTIVTRPSFDKIVYERNGGDYSCQHCGLKSSVFSLSLASLLKHEKRCAKKLKKKIPNFVKCKHCSRLFISDVSLERHISSEHGNETEPSEDKGKTNSFSYCCGAPANLLTKLAFLTKLPLLY